MHPHEIRTHSTRHDDIIQLRCILQWPDFAFQSSSSQVEDGKAIMQ